MLWYLCGMNLGAFLLMGLDKRRAIRNQWRVPEKLLLGCAALGGAGGGLAGMYLFRHKTRHWYFRFGLPVLTALWCLALLWLSR